MAGQPKTPCPGIAHSKGLPLLPSEVQGPRARHINLPASFNLTGPSSSDPTLRPPDLTLAGPWPAGRSFPPLLPAPPQSNSDCKGSLQSSPWPPTGVSLLCYRFSQPLNFSSSVGRDRLAFAEKPWRFSLPGHFGSPLSPSVWPCPVLTGVAAFSLCDGIAAIPGSGEEADKEGLRHSCIHISPERKTQSKPSFLDRTGARGHGQGARALGGG